MFKSNRQRLKGKLLNTVKHFIWKALLFSLSTNFQLVVCTLKTSQPICICRSGGPFPVLWCTDEPRGSKLKFSVSTVTWTGTGPGIPTPRPAQQNSLCPTLQAWKQWQVPFHLFPDRQEVRRQTHWACDAIHSDSGRGKGQTDDKRLNRTWQYA